ncbi:hypothetical protein I9W82_002219 [Candida metapsilosis]|uniref:Uncharacterized protein n=1 Tax=Candida metapsilosis TaxID=273372 RepID=A0A8H8DBE8_9ASCO|nr:hypothetical protein I9W82_002219 [Candida metapsilosis]
MTSVIPRSSHASIVTGSSLDPFNQENDYRYPASIGTSYGHSRTHSRAVSQSNPFEVIYSNQDLTFDSTKPQSLTVPKQKPSARNFRQHSPWHSQSNYDLIAENIKTGKSPVSELANNSSSSTDNNNSSGNHHPVVTVVGSPVLQRSGSTISRSATLRNRNRIKQRNKTVKRKDLFKEKPEFKPNEENKKKSNEQKAPWFSWPKFTFPVLRKRSLKYRSVHNGQTPNFTTRHEFMNFLQMSNYNQIVGSSLPHKVKMWNYTQPLHPHPLLHWHIEEFGKKDTTIIKSGNLHSRTESVSVLDVLYQNYKTRAFELAQRRYYKRRRGGDYVKVPPPFQKLYPQDAILLSKRELHQLNTKLLVEILLRRTVAAKLEYRLGQHGTGLRSASINSFSSSPSSSSSSHSQSTTPSSSSSQSRARTSPSGRTDRRDHPKTRFSSPGSGAYQNDNLALQNQGIFQDIIPSSNGPSPKDKGGATYFQSQPKSNISSKHSLFANPFTLDPKPNIARKNEGTSPHQAKQAKPIYELTPQQQRSRSTLTSEESSASSDYKNSPLLAKESDSYTDSFTNVSSNKMRKSDSTTKTSILHYLDHLSSEASSVLEELDVGHVDGGTSVVKKSSTQQSPSAKKLGSRRTVPKNIVEPAGIIKKLNEYDLRVI